MSTEDVRAITLQGMQHDMTRLQQIGMNLANALTPGYKRGMSVQAPEFGVTLQALQQAGGAGAAHAGEAGAMAASALRIATDARTGTLKRTGLPLDLAVVGDAYFEVSTPQGPVYTRQGSFQLDAQGRVVGPGGHRVMGRDGEIRLTGASPVVSEDGAITDPDAPAAAQRIGAFKLVRFEPGTELVPLGEGLLAAGPAAAPRQADDAQVRQGFLENSNVNSAHEMTQLIQTMRHFEGLQKMAQAHDDMLGTAIRKLGELS